MNRTWTMTNLGPVKAREEIEEIIPNFIDFENDFGSLGIEEIYYELEFHNSEQSWTILRSKNEILKFLHKIYYHFSLLLSIEAFLSTGLPECSQLNGIEEIKFFREFFENDFEQFNKVKNMKMLKKGGGRYSQFCICQANWFKWRVKDFIITKDGIFYCDQHENTPKEFIAFGRSFSYKMNLSDEDFEIQLRSNHRLMSIRAQSFKDYFNFYFFLKKALKQNKQSFRFDSFSPIRSNNQVEFLIDGKEYFRKVALMMEKAEEEVFISGWWVSPEFHLIRPCEGANLKYRLDTLVHSLARKGVKIYIIVYWESSFLSNESIHTENVFKKMGPNVKIIRHPNIILPSFWSHHEKIVIIDQKIAFLGGLDLCYGRYDTDHHSLSENGYKIFPGIQYNNTRKKDFYELKKISRPSISRDLPRLPWHDIGVMLAGPCIKDICHHFIEYWNFASFQIHNVKRSVLVPQSSKITDSKKHKFSSFFRNQFKKINNYFRKEQQQEKEKQRRDNEKMESSQHLQKGMEMKEEISAIESKCIRRIRKYQRRNFENNVVDPKQQKQQQMKMEENEDIRKCVSTKEQINESDNMNQEIEEKYRQQILNVRMKEKKSVLQFEESERQNTNFNDFLSQKFDFSHFAEENNKNNNPEAMEQSEHFQCQILRSASRWSIGCKQQNFEKSIYNAYLELIRNSKRFIYIENQFFISAVKENDVIENRIADALFDRIKLAIQKEQKFMVIIMIPLIPGFPGELDSSQASVPKAIMHWQYRTISRHNNSLLQRVSRITGTPENYIKFLSLRTHGLVSGKPFTEIIYIHSKLMIVDDWKALVGSANINDRSMNGDRDSEICILIEGAQDLQIQLQNGSKLSVNKTIHYLRLQLWKEHFNNMADEMKDPNNTKFLKSLFEEAKKNTMIYRKIFGCYPDQNIQKLKDLHKLSQASQISQYEELSKQITSHVVQFPHRFLSEENLTNLHPNAIST